MGEGDGLDPRSTRYQVGVFFDHALIPVIAVPILPYVLVRDGLHISGSFDLILAPIYIFLLAYPLGFLFGAKNRKEQEHEARTRNG